MAELKVADTKLGKLRWKDPDKLRRAYSYKDY